MFCQESYFKNRNNCMSTLLDKKRNVHRKGVPLLSDTTQMSSQYTPSPVWYIMTESNCSRNQKVKRRNQSLLISQERVLSNCKMHLDLLKKKFEKFRHSIDFDEIRKHRSNQSITERIEKEQSYTNNESMTSTTTSNNIDSKTVSSFEIKYIMKETVKKSNLFNLKKALSHRKNVPSRQNDLTILSSAH